MRFSSFHPWSLLRTVDVTKKVKSFFVSITRIPPKVSSSLFASWIIDGFIISLTFSPRCCAAKKESILDWKEENEKQRRRWRKKEESVVNKSVTIIGAKVRRRDPATKRKKRLGFRYLYYKSVLRTTTPFVVCAGKSCVCCTPKGFLSRLSLSRNSNTSLLPVFELYYVSNATPRFQ